MADLLTQTKDAESSGSLPATPAASNPMTLLAMAVERGTDPAQLEKLMDLQERYERNRAAEELSHALAAFQQQCPQIKKDKRADRFNYASYDDIMHHIQPVLAECGLSVAFDMEQTQAGMMACTVIVKRGIADQRTRLTVPIPDSIKVSSTQQYGAAVSYVKRYALCAALNIVVTGEDRETLLPGLNTITQEQQTTIYNLLAETDSDIAAFLKWAGVEELSLMPANKYAMAVAALNKKKAKVKA